MALNLSWRFVGIQSYSCFRLARTDVNVFPKFIGTPHLPCKPTMEASLHRRLWMILSSEYWRPPHSLVLRVVRLLSSYAKTIFKAYNGRVKTWYTFNEPRVYCSEFGGYPLRSSGERWAGNSMLTLNQVKPLSRSGIETSMTSFWSFIWVGLLTSSEMF
jgi:hypothetical protein